MTQSFLHVSAQVLPSNKVEIQTPELMVWVKVCVKIDLSLEISQICQACP
jgi:hypothetical protein